MPLRAFCTYLHYHFGLLFASAGSSSSSVDHSLQDHFGHHALKCNTIRDRSAGITLSEIDFIWGWHGPSQGSYCSCFNNPLLCWCATSRMLLWQGCACWLGLPFPANGRTCYHSGADVGNGTSQNQDKSWLKQISDVTVYKCYICKERNFRISSFAARNSPPPTKSGYNGGCCNMKIATHVVLTSS